MSSRPERPRRSWATWACALALSVLGGCRDRASAGAAATTSAKPNGPTPHELVLRVADQGGLSRGALELAGELEANYRIEWSRFPAGPPLLEALASGAVDIGAVGDSPPIFAQAAGAQLAIVAALRLSPKYESLLVPAASKIRSVPALKGKKVAVAKGSGAHHLLLAALEREGLGINDIHPIYLTPTDAQPAFASGVVDAWAVWDPYAIDAVLHGARRLVDGEGLMVGLNYQVASPGVLADPERAALIEDYLTRAQRAQQYTNSHRDAWARRYAELTKLSPEVTRAMFAYYTPVYVPITPGVIADQQRLADDYWRAKLIGQALNVSLVFDLRFNRLLTP